MTEKQPKLLKGAEDIVAAQKAQQDAEDLKQVSLEDIRQRLGPIVSDNRPDPELEYNLPAVTLALLDYLEQTGAPLREMLMPYRSFPKKPLIQVVQG